MIRWMCIKHTFLFERSTKTYDNKNYSSALFVIHYYAEKKQKRKSAQLEAQRTKLAAVPRDLNMLA